jgi:hypothetical protein
VEELQNRLRHLLRCLRGNSAPLVHLVEEGVVEAAVTSHATTIAINRIIQEILVAIVEITQAIKGDMIPADRLIVEVIMAMILIILRAAILIVLAVTALAILVEKVITEAVTVGVEGNIIMIIKAVMIIEILIAQVATERNNMNNIQSDQKLMTHFNQAELLTQTSMFKRNNIISSIIIEVVIVVEVVLIITGVAEIINFNFKKVHQKGLYCNNGNPYILCLIFVPN